MRECGTLLTVNDPSNRWVLLVIVLCFLGLLWQTQPYTLFHTVVEFIAIFIAMSLFDMGSHAYRYSQSKVLYFLSIGAFHMALIDGIHTLAYTGMNLIPLATTDHAIQLWIAARFVQLISLVLVPLVIRYDTRISKRMVEVFFIVISTLLLGLILVGWFPACYEAGKGLTLFKILAEYVIVLFVIAGIILIKRLDLFSNRRIVSLVRLSLVFLALSELSFTLYEDVYGLFNAVGHFLKIISLFFIWVLVVEEGYAKPYENLFAQTYHNSIHDQLTGLFNRRYFDLEFSHVIQRFALRPLSVVMADINGLKLINDAFGHHEGDRLIVTFVQLLQSKCKSNDILIRLGGDEFLVIIPDTSDVKVEGFVKHVSSLFSELHSGKIPYSVSFGVASKDTDQFDGMTLVAKAEERMYHYKLANSPSIKAHIIETALQRVYAMHPSEEEHSLHVASLCEDFAKAMGFSPERVHLMGLAGRLHDIGKVHGWQPGTLDGQSFDEKDIIHVKRHTEVGFTLLSAVNKYCSIAEIVLHHHEWWNGKGYPVGLAGADIPIESRMIAIAETYDAIVSDRPYKEKRTHTEAVAELRRCAESQFDPTLVDVFITKVLAQKNLG